MVASSTRNWASAGAVRDGSETTNESRTLGAYLEQNRYSPAFIRQYIVPMAGAIWSAGRA